MTAPSEVAADIVVIVLIIGCCGAPSLRYESALIEVDPLDDSPLAHDHDGAVPVLNTDDDLDVVDLT